MSEDLKDILSHLNPDIDQEIILRYLQGKLSAEEQHDLEKQMMDQEFDSEAMEGLQDFKNKKDISLLVNQLNKDLRERTEKKKNFRKKLQLRFEPWLLISIVIILILIVIGFILVYSKMHH